MFCLIKKERERLQAMMAHLHMTKDAVNNDQDKREGSISVAEKKSAEPLNTGKLCKNKMYKIYTVFQLILAPVKR